MPLRHRGDAVSAIDVTKDRATGRIVAGIGEAANHRSGLSAAAAARTGSSLPSSARRSPLHLRSGAPSPDSAFVLGCWRGLGGLAPTVIRLRPAGIFKPGHDQQGFPEAPKPDSRTRHSPRILHSRHSPRIPFIDESLAKPGHCRRIARGVLRMSRRPGRLFPVIVRHCRPCRLRAEPACPSRAVADGG
jgi:hypothetical protein